MIIIDDRPVAIRCERCVGTGYVGNAAAKWACLNCGGIGDTRFDRCRLLTLAHNLAIAGALFASFRAGDNFGFHMGADESQCTCQWSPGSGEPYRGLTRCEQDELYEDDRHDFFDDDYESDYEDRP